MNSLNSLKAIFAVHVNDIYTDYSKNANIA